MVPACAGAGEVSDAMRVPVPGGSLAVADGGEGDVVLMHPSLGRPASDFDHLANVLRKEGFRVCAIDPRGVGESTGDLDGLTLAECAADVARVAAHIGADRVHVIGHAFGNRVMRMLATMRPDLVETITLLGAGGRFEPDEEARPALARCFGPQDDEQLAAVEIAFFAPGNDPSVWRDDWYRDAAAAQGPAARQAVLDEWWDGGTAPMLVVQGLQDRTAPPENGRALAADRPGTTLVEIDGAGHALLPEQPQAVADAVLAFLLRR
jgi:pimeloyl-ACP methyl ester carboxylesterase